MKYIRELCTVLSATCLLMFQTVALADDATVPNPIVAMAFDASAKVLFKATNTSLERSEDAGLHWSPVSLPQDVSAGRLTGVATPSQRTNALYLTGTGIGVLRSEDGGRHWTSRNEGLPSKDVEAIATHADQADTVYATVTGQGMFRSEDSGAHWQLMDRGPRGRIERFIHSNMPGSMKTGWLFAATSQGVARSMDCFCGWRDAGGLGREISALAYDPHQPQQVYAATRQGLLLSTNGGEQWNAVKSPSPSITALLVMPDGAVYAAGGGMLFRSRDQAQSWERIDV